MAKAVGSSSIIAL